jgi:Ca2+/Na+ antiporter
VIPSDKIKIFISFMILIPIHLIHHSYRMPIVFILALLSLSSAALLFDKPILAEQIATYSFWLLIVGFILLAIRYFRFENHKSEVDIPQPQNIGRNTA